MRIEYFDWDGRDAHALAAEIRALQPQLGEVSDAVSEIIAAVRLPSAPWQTGDW